MFIKFTVCIILLALMLIECKGAEKKLKLGTKKKIPPEECKIKTKKLMILKCITRKHSNQMGASLTGAVIGTNLLNFNLVSSKGAIKGC